MRLDVRVVPNAGAFSVSLKDGTWRVHVRAKAEGGKANRELVDELSGALGARVSIVGGSKSRRKVLEIEGSEGGVRERLLAIANEKG